MTEADAEEFDKFVEKHWGKESVFSIEKYKAQRKQEAADTKKAVKLKKETK